MENFPSFTTVIALSAAGSLAISCGSNAAEETSGSSPDGSNGSLGVAGGLGTGVDLNGDGAIDSFDFHGDGLVVGPGIDTNADGIADAIGHDTDGDSVIDALDTDGDGVADRFVPSDDGDDGGGTTINPNALPPSTDEPDTSPMGNGMPEVCDGIDNDENGIIDDLDAGGDGICDCLNIGTIGHIGPWGEGNIFTDWLNTRSPRPATALADQVLTPELLAPLDVIVVLRADTAPMDNDGSPAHHSFSAAEVAALEAWIRAGGGMMTTIGYQGDEVAEMQNVNLLLAPFGLGYDPAATELAYGLLEDWDTTHPIADGVSSINVQNGVGPLTTVGTIVASTTQSEPALVAHEVDGGHVVVHGDEWITYDSEWADVEEQQVERLWLNLIKWLSPPTECQVDIPDIVR